MKQYFEVLGYSTLEDFENRRFQAITDLNCSKKIARRIANGEIKTGKWYAVKFQSEDREEIEILTY